MNPRHAGSVEIRDESKTQAFGKRRDGNGGRKGWNEGTY
jgi:hypothetical protein